MGTVYKILGQSAPGSTTGNLYTVPASTQTVISTLSICNTTSSNITCNVWAVANAGSPSITNQLVGGATVNGNDTLLLTLGVSLGTAGDTIRCNSSSSSVGFSVFGSEVS